MSTICFYKRTAYFQLISCLFILILVVTTISVFEYRDRNAWSLNYVKNKLAAPISSFVLNFPPENHPRAPIWLARDALTNNNPDQARRLLSTLSNNGDRDALLIVGESHVISGDYSRALQTWSNIDDVNQLFSASIDKHNYSILVDEARKNHEIGDYDNALLAYRAAYMVNKEDGTLPLATILWISFDKQSEAEILIIHALDKYPNSSQRLGWLRTLSNLYRTENRWNEAEDILKILLEDNPYDWWSYIELGWVYYERGDDLELVFDAITNAIEIDSSNGDGYFAMGQVLAREECYEEADILYTQALEIYPNKPGWWLTRGNIARKSDNLGLALSVYRKTILLFPEYAPGFYEIAQVYQMNDQIQEALQMIENAIVLLDEPNVWYYVRAGQIYEWAGDIEMSIKYYYEALNIDPNNNAALEGHQRISGEDYLQSP